MVELVYGTRNRAKLASMTRTLEGLRITLLGLDGWDDLPEVEENGATPLENARLKAQAYGRALGRPVFSCDSGLYFDGVAEEDQPGVHVRMVGERRLSDEEMVAHYSGLAARYGGLTARYRNAICLALPDGRLVESMDDSLSDQPFRLVAQPHPKRVPGFPLDCLSVHLGTGLYYYDRKEHQADDIAWRKEFRRFFQQALPLLGG